MAGPTGQIKVCPSCGQSSELNAPSCSRCGHAFRTQFTDPSQTQRFSSPPQPGFTQFPNPYPMRTGAEGYAIAALVLGIVSIVGMCVRLIAIPCGVLGVIFGILGRDSQHRGMAVAGFVCGIVGLAAWAVIAFTLAAAISGGSSGASPR